MSSPRHRAAPARPSARIWLRAHLRPVLVSTSLTAMVVGVGVAGIGETGPAPVTAAMRAGVGAALDADQASFDARGERASRTAKRIKLTPQPVAPRWASDDLNIWSGPGERSKRVGLLDAGTKVAVTGQVQGRWAEVLLGKGKKQQVRWVNNDFLLKRKPQPPTPAVTEAGDEGDESVVATTAARGVSSAPCVHGSGVESGLTSTAIGVYRAVCAAFPSVSSYGGLRPGDSGAHGSGRGLDIMISGAAGWAIAEWLRANAGALGVSEVIYSQKIWTVQRGGEGWRYMSNRGSATANHYDHVHVSVY